MKKALSLALALVLCLSILPMAASAADTLSCDQLYPAGEWHNNDSSITLSGVVREYATPNMALNYTYDVAVGGSLTLDMSYTNEERYIIQVGGIYGNPDKEAYWKDPAYRPLQNGWAVPAGCEGGVFDESLGKMKYVYNFTESDIGEKDGYEKYIHVEIIWDNGPDYGSVYFNIHVVPAVDKPAEPEKPTEPVKPNIPDVPDTGTVTFSTQPVNIDGKAVDLLTATVKISSGSVNYVYIRDLAVVLAGTDAKFNVGWDGAVALTKGEKYTGEGVGDVFGETSPYTKPDDVTKLDGTTTDFKAIRLNDAKGGGYTFYQLRDLGYNIGFNVGWTAEKGMFIETDKPYTGK